MQPTMEEISNISLMFNSMMSYMYHYDPKLETSLLFNFRPILFKISAILDFVGHFDFFTNSSSILEDIVYIAIWPHAEFRQICLFYEIAYGPLWPCRPELHCLTLSDAPFSKYRPFLMLLAILNFSKFVIMDDIVYSSSWACGPKSNVHSAI